MVARNRLPPWHEEVRLANGRDVLIRPIRPNDAAILRAGFDLLEPEPLRLALLEGAPELSPDAAHRLARPDPRNEFTLVVAEPLPAGEALIAGFGRTAVVEGTRDAGFVILVGRHVSALGLRRHLLRRLVRWARGKKLQRLHGEVPTDSDAMLDLVQSMGFRLEAGGTAGLARVVIDLAPD